MNIVLLSGGSGKRLWPLSNDIRSKQFIKLFKTEDGIYESMVQRVFRQIRTVDSNAKITIATSKKQVPSIYNQLGEDAELCVEPCRRDTFPAMALAAAYLHDIKGLSEDEVIVICPIDPFVEIDYFMALKQLSLLAGSGDCNLALMGITPTYPSEKYGYIIPAEKGEISGVRAFKEKPDLETAQSYLQEGALWNGGVFACKIKYILDKALELTGYSDYKNLFASYCSLPKISFDYAVVENEMSIKVMRFKGKWKDLGTWNTLTEAMDELNVGNAIQNNNENVHIVNELDIPVLCMGLKNMVVSASPEGILVSDKSESSYIKPFADKLQSQIMFAEKSWGSFRVLDIEEASMTIKVTLHSGHKMKYHSHSRRNEIWTVISGKGRAIINDTEQQVNVGDVILIEAGSRHTLIADTELKVIEVQLGKDISVNDKQKFDSYNY